MVFYNPHPYWLCLFPANEEPLWRRWPIIVSTRSLLLWWASAGGLRVGLPHPEACQRTSALVQVWRQLHSPASPQPEREEQPGTASAEGGPGDCRSRAADRLPRRWQTLQTGGVWGKPLGNRAGAREGWIGEVGVGVSKMNVMWCCDDITDVGPWEWQLWASWIWIPFPYFVALLPFNFSCWVDQQIIRRQCDYVSLQDDQINDPLLYCS